jgi:DNA-binding NtrC family response regulator
MKHFSHLIDAARAQPHVVEPLLAGNTVVAYALRQMVTLAASANQPVLITGPKGSGKTSLARAIHMQSPHADHAFIANDCLNINKDMFCTPWEGTLFLNEVGLLSPMAQKALLNWLDSDNNFYAQLIASTSQPLTATIENGVFDTALNTRLAALSIPCPPLIWRKDDIPMILDRLWVTEYADGAPVICQEALTPLLAHNWPGNFSELRQFANKAARLYHGQAITALQVADLIGRSAYRATPNQPLSLKQHLAHEERLYLVDAWRRSQSTLQVAAKQAGVTPATFMVKMRRYGITPA